MNTALKNALLSSAGNKLMIVGGGLLATYIIYKYVKGAAADLVHATGAYVDDVAKTVAKPFVDAKAFVDTSYQKAPVAAQPMANFTGGSFNWKQTGVVLSPKTEAAPALTTQDQSWAFYQNQPFDYTKNADTYTKDTLSTSFPLIFGK